ncbi:HNH endonuclease signature motif containing protein [Williamsia sp. CHRR-6]|uniref:HNH endonuclease signature motif containing protein n=1 Tax=Williamsia sp. CHRR-6 TaxID=2835871 RepID=UPI001BDB6224|nr:HNH endonuclease signature motif containing protein [Williamsia sp. CHRR-6]MBT0567129.1 DUF222 domain-containing protein [Williamsia sp. CHRR-6]
MFDKGWPEIDPAGMGVSAQPAALDAAGILGELRHVTAGLSFLEWQRYRLAAEMSAQTVDPVAESDVRVFDAMALCATSIATVLNISPGAGAGLLDRAVTLRDRLPRVLECLRDGAVAPKHIYAIVSRTDLVSGTDYAHQVDAEIADQLRRRGSWSDRRLRDMVDRIIYRHDPYAVRARRDEARSNRSFWTSRDEDGMGGVHATMSAENVALLAKRVEQLGDSVCADDGRSRTARRSDALFCITTGTEWECQCGNDSCDAATSDAAPAPMSDGAVATPARLNVHVVAQADTVAGTSQAPGFIDGYGVISADQVRDLVARPDVKLTPMHAAVSGAPVPTFLPSDPYRPSAALDRFVRIRDLYCTWPGCDQPAFGCDLDHVDEFDHDDPAAGGDTTPDGLGAKCRFHHLIKTFTGFVDDQFRDPNTGHLTSTVTTPEGVTVDGPVHTGIDIFPGLDDIEFEPPTATFTRMSDSGDEPTRRRTRLADKHARRRAERNRNRMRREQADADHDDGSAPPF